MNYKTIKVNDYEKSIHEYLPIGHLSFHAASTSSWSNRSLTNSLNPHSYQNMKTALKLVLIYFGMQILATLTASPFAILYAYIKYSDIDRATDASLSYSLLIGFIYMGIYLWWKGYLTGDKLMYKSIPSIFLLWSTMLGASGIFLLDYLMSFLDFLPDWMDTTFNFLQSGWLGIICISILGPILEELLFRGAITKVLLRKYAPLKAILLSGLLFGLFHINPAQVISATLFGFVFAWLYYKTRSLIPCILIHIINNSLSVYLNISYPDIDTTSELIGKTPYLICIATSVALFILSWRMMNTYKLPELTTET